MFDNVLMMFILLPFIEFFEIASIGNLQELLLSFLDLNLGNPLPFLKNDLKALSRFINVCC